MCSDGLDPSKQRSFGMRYSVALGLLLTLTGCGGDVSNSPTSDSATPAEAVSAGPPTSTVATSRDSSKSAVAAKAEEKFEFKPLALDGVVGSPTDATGTSAKPDPEKQIQAVIAKLQPLQILLGQWRGTTRREYENFKAVDVHEWVWDLRSNPAQPALTIQSDKSPYIKTGRLTWDSEQNKFAMTATDPAGTTRQFTGDFTEPVHEIVGSDDKLHRVFRLEFNQNEISESSELWQLAFAQQENNRYLLEVGRRRGKADFSRFDTVSTQREGTSFAVSDAGYADKTCIISEGLGTMEVTYKGRSYWVCCTGCKAAFEEDPETWIVRAAKKAVPK
ncbi:MAG: hypothetical protein DWI22_18650 [Planctomycetota bacterium]|nr:MAG: hypothetical protein DWI22_18650 [Planctomycetota bacterium]